MTIRRRSSQHSGFQTQHSPSHQPGPIVVHASRPHAVTAQLMNVQPERPHPNGSRPLQPGPIVAVGVPPTGRAGNPKSEIPGRVGGNPKSEIRNPKCARP